MSDSTLSLRGGHILNLPKSDITKIARDLGHDAPDYNGFYVDYQFEIHNYIADLRGWGGDLVFFQRGDATPLSVGDTKTHNGRTYYVAAVEQKDYGRNPPFIRVYLMSRYPGPLPPILSGWLGDFGSNTFHINFYSADVARVREYEVEESFDGTNFHFLAKVESGPFTVWDLPPLCNVAYRVRTVDTYSRPSDWSDTLWMQCEFKRHIQNPVKIKGSVWDTWGVFAPCVAFDADLYHLLWTGATGALTGYQIGHATLTRANWRAGNTGDSYWTDDVANPVVSPAGTGFMQNGVGEASLMRLPPWWILSFTGYDNHNGGGMDAAGIGLAFANSLNGPWKVSSTTTPIIGPGSPGQWDDYDVFGCHIWYGWDGKYHALYSAGSDNTNQWQIGHAYSTDLFSVFTKDAANPVYTAGASGAWDDYANCHPRVYPYGSFLLHYVNGVDAQAGVGGTFQIGTAWTNSQLETFYRTPFNPDMGATGAGFDTSLQIGHLLFKDPFARMFYLFYGCTDSTTAATEAQIRMATLWR